ncbi:MAG: ABC-F family ATP-binding cassette domain-containing protein, partial [Bacteroidales bacterium]|nr:ABC-F family ATP-binding cassette domain-containing protein [Bacteroidales bacterium]
MNYLSAENISKSFGEQTLFEGITFGLERGEKAAIIARNGTGKTTLLRILAGMESSDSGDFTFRNNIKVAFLEQSPDLDQTVSIDELILTANTSVLTVIKHYEKVLQEHSRQHTEQTASDLEDATTEMDRLHAWDYERRLRQLLDLFRITNTEQLVGKLSGGEKKRLAMALVLLDEPDFLILDEPTNDLDLFALNKLEEFLLNFKGCLVIVSHDRYLLDKLTDHLFIFEGGGHIRDHYGTCSAYRQEKAP